MGNLATRVTKDASRQIRGGHPWVYDASITSIGDGETGDLAVIFDDHRKFMAIGLYDPDSPIRIKILHHGSPVPIDAGFWRDRVAAALAVREPLARASTTTAYRVIHGENDGLPGFVLDRYGDVLVVKLYSAAWFRHLDDVLAAVSDVLEPTAIVLRLARNVSPDGDRGDGSALLGTRPEGPVVYRENGLEFEADVVVGQKTGAFLDQRDNRARLRAITRGARVLDVFSSTGGFSVHAAAGGAELVHSVDLNQASIDASKRNMARNAALKAVAASRHLVTTGDAFEVMATMAADRRTFDVVVIDPPSFASKQTQIPRALESYARLTELAGALVERGGTLVQSSCSSRVTPEDFVSTVRSGVRRAGRTIEESAQYGHAVDHPVGFAEGGYLKSVFATLA